MIALVSRQTVDERKHHVQVAELMAHAAKAQDHVIEATKKTAPVAK
jgi:hypothetical protein